MRKKNKININKIRPSYGMLLFVILLFLVFGFRIVYLCTTNYRVGDSTIMAFIESRNTKEEILLPKRGSIIDANGNVLAEDVASYTVIAYLDESRSEGSKEPLHVIDVDVTAERLAPYLEMDVSVLKILLSKDAYQVELGPGGRNLSQIQMEEIKDLNLPGIDFIASTKRYYPSGDFASYAVGYTVNQNDEDGNVWKVGQLGVEEYFNEDLTGTSGYIRYEKDRSGYKIANGREYIEEADDGDDVYLTIDSNIQLFTENAVKKMVSDSEAEWGFMVVADADTGAILSYSTAPSFDPNVRNITNYIDLLTGDTYEPGSTMKIFSYLCAIDNGSYDGNSTYDSGSIVFEAGGSRIVVHDWNKRGWGNITYDYGFAMSSNVGAAGLLRSEMIDKKKLKACYNAYGFGSKTGFSLDREVTGKIKFNYDVDAASATFGQAITITPIQMIQALTMISNDGKLLKPYLVSKIVDTDTNELSYEATTEVIDVVSDVKSIAKIKELMKSVVCNDNKMCTGSAYYMDEYPIMGKTGTAQIYDSRTGTYMTGDSDYIYSFAGLYPIDDPEIIIYAALKRPKDETNYVAPAVRDVVVNTSKYLNIIVDEYSTDSYKLSSYVNKEVDSVKSELEKNNMRVYVLGTGEKIINQFPLKNSEMYAKSVVVLLTDTYDKTMPNLVGLSYKDAVNILKLMGVKYSLTGNGYVVNQSISEGTVVGDDVIVELKFENGY